MSDISGFLRKFTLDLVDLMNEIEKDLESQE